MAARRGILHGTTEKMVEWKSMQDSSTHSSPLRDDSFGRNDTQNCHFDERFLRGEIFRETPGMPIKMQRTTGITQAKRSLQDLRTSDP